MTEAALHSLLETFHNINFSCKTKDNDGSFLCLSNVEKVVQQSLT
jgi:hypothetical protein